MTNREFYNAIVNGTMNDEIKAFASEAIVKLDERNAKRNSRPSKTAIANEPIKEEILKLFAENQKLLASEVGTALNISTQKASALLRQLVESEKLSVSETKVAKKGVQKIYRIK